jgi:hypothetical protein
MSDVRPVKAQTGFVYGELKSVQPGRTFLRVAWAGRQIERIRILSKVDFSTAFGSKLGYCRLMFVR